MSTLRIRLRRVFRRFVQSVSFISATLLSILPAYAAEPNGTTFYGALSGTLAVSPTGAATYNVPIKVAPGIGAMTPELSLHYNSQAGNGLLGMGWSVRGLSMIARCPATLAQDDLIDPVDLDANDRYCLDGQRLIAVRNTGCGSGAEYRTEIDSYARVCAYGSAGTGPAWFRMWTKSGQVLEYARTADSRIEASGAGSVMIWAVNRVEDAVGNYFTVTYQEDNASGEYRPQRIDYAGNDAQGMAPYHSIRFFYEARDDVSTAYFVNRPMQVSMRMRRVAVYAGGALLRDYRLAYSYGPRTGRSRMTDLQRCEGAGASTQCQPATAFAWSSGVASFEDVINTGRSNVGYQYAQPIDVNGDGLTDLAYCASDAANWQVLFSRGDAFGPPNDSGRRCTNHRYALPFDYDTDGRTDLLVPYANGRWYVLRWESYGFALIDTGIGHAGYQNRPVVLDVNGDGRDDLALAYNGAWYLRINNGEGFKAPIATGIAATNWQYRLKIDYDGDGRDDVLVPYANNRWYVLRSTGSTLQLVNTGSSSYGYDKDPQVMDVDGDGRQDLVVNGITKQIYFNRGNTLAEPVTTGIGTQWSATTFQLDYNGDGRMDLIMPGPPSSATAGNWYVLRSHGSGFDVINTGVNSWGHSNSPKTGDYNGDGFVDIALAYSSVWMLRLHASGIADQLTAVNDGLSRRSSISYKPLTDPNVYTTGNAKYPSISVRGPMYVVAEQSTDNGVGGAYVKTYRYANGKSDLRGRGFLGFSRFTSTDEQTNIVTRVNYHQSFPLTGLVVVEESGFGEIWVVGEPLTENAPFWSTSEPYPGVYQINLDRREDVTYELNGGGFDYISVVDTRYAQYDAYGNPGEITLTTTADGVTHTKTTTNTYDNDVARWHLGRLSATQVVSSVPDSTDIRTSQFEYDPLTGLLSAEVLEPNDPQLTLRTEYGYDGFGNQTSVTVRDSGTNSYPITAATSRVEYNFTELAASGTYTITSVNAKGHTEIQLIDARFGVPLNLTGPNGLVTHWDYDVFGRRTGETRADGTSTRSEWIWCNSSCAGAAHAAYQMTTQTDGAPTARVNFDRLGRQLRSSTMSLTGVYVDSDIQYNALGQIRRTARPRFHSAAAHWTDYEYDAVGRLNKEHRADGGIIEITYSGLTTTRRRHSDSDSYDQTVVRSLNVDGKVVQMTDEGGSNTRYDYDAFGNLVRVTDAANNTTEMTYDRRGRKTGMDDPDMGRWEYRYDALDRLRWQKDAKNQVTRMNYDVLGRLSNRTTPEGSSTWTYDAPSGKGLGKPREMRGHDGYLERYTYDDLGRPSAIRYTVNGVVWDTATEYDGFGRVETLIYPDGFGIKYGYSSSGHLMKVSNAADSGDVYWTAHEASPEGRITSETLGNGIRTVRTFRADSGRLEYLGSYRGETAVQMLNYVHDSQGNLVSRNDAVNGLTETFEYDVRNRLTDAVIAGVGSRVWRYDDLGNITEKDRYTDYSYGSAGAQPHAVTTARGYSYQYDANGNMQSGAGRAITWNTANLPVRIAKGAATVEFSYTPEGARYKQISVKDGQQQATVYIGRAFERVSSQGISTNRIYIHAAGRLVAIREYQAANGTATLRYLHQDHLGSTDVITDAAGQVLERQSFDAFGTRRIAGDWRAPLTPIVSVRSTRGYTAHEQLDAVGLIHMNGRVYDPQLGRFISADPIVQAPGNSQSLNRFAYVVNNPLRYTDPSGFGLDEELGDFFSDPGDYINDHVIQPLGDAIGVDREDFAPYAPLVAIVVAPYAGFYIGTTYGLSTAAGYAVTGFTAGMIASGGDLRTGLIGAATAVGFAGVDALARAGQWTGASQVLAHGAVSGVSNVATGGRFQDGFLSGGFTRLAVPAIGSAPGDWIGRTVVAAAVGGAAATLGGGKFANGARTFGFLRLFGEAADHYRRRVGYDIDMGPGGDAVEKGFAGMPVEGANNAGTQRRWVYDGNGQRVIGFFEEGGPVSSFVNQIWGGNATAGFHDTLQISMGNSVWRDALNVPGMGVAAGITYSGFIGQTLNAVGPIMVPINDEGREGRYQWVMYAP